MHRLCRGTFSEGDRTVLNSENEMKGLLWIDERYAVKVCDIDYALVRVSGKNGDSIKTLGYWGTIEKCLRQYLKESVHEKLLSAEGRTTLVGALKTIREVIEACEEKIALSFPEYKVVKE